LEIIQKMSQNCPIGFERMWNVKRKELATFHFCKLGKLRELLSELCPDLAFFRKPSPKKEAKSLGEKPGTGNLGKGQAPVYPQKGDPALEVGPEFSLLLRI
jgi:hypothetical protein